MPEQTCEQPRPARLGRAPLIPIRQSVRRTGGEHAPSVCVASAGGVALWEDQHVLAQCGQMVAAERAAVRGGLQVLSRAHSPPARVRLALVAHTYIRSPPPCSRMGRHRVTTRGFRAQRTCRPRGPIWLEYGDRGLFGATDRARSPVPSRQERLEHGGSRVGRARKCPWFRAEPAGRTAAGQPARITCGGETP